MQTTDTRPAILVTGATGGLANVVVNLLAERYQLVGIDPRPLPPGQDFPGAFHQADYTQRRVADIFRRTHFEALLHLGRVPVTSTARRSKRYNLNVLGTRNLLELAAKYHVKNVVVCSTFHVYGAHQHNHLHITEDDPLRASQLFPELVDAVEMDNVSTAFLLRHRDVRTVILRPVNIVGPRIQNQMTRILRNKYVPTLMGYDPMLQFIHEQDMAKALSLCLKGDKSGVYNVAGEGVVSFTKSIEITGGTAVPVPHLLAYPTVGILRRMGLRFPKHLLDYFRFPTVVSDDAFRKDFGYAPDIKTIEALQSIRGAE